MSVADTRARTPSVSELQAALLAARRGDLARGPSGVEPARVEPAAARHRSASGDVVPPARLPTVRLDDPGSGVWLLGTHGGSGARCLARVLTGTRLAAKQWPSPAAGREPVVLVCRSSQRGLASAQEYARQFRDENLGEHLNLLGVVLSADAPGRVPPALRRFERLLSGAAPILGEVPWQPGWRLGPAQPFAETPGWLTKLQQALASVVPR